MSRSALALLDGESDQRGRAYALSGMGQIYASLADYPRALTNLQSALLLMQKIGDKRGEGRVLSQIGVAHYLSGQSKFAIEYLDRALGVLRRVQDRFFEGQTRQNLSRAYLATGDLVRATDYNAEALMIANSLGDVRGEASALRNLAQIESSRQEVGRATEHLRKARTLFQRIRNRDNEADCLLALARLSWDSGHRQAALLHIEDALKIIESQRGKVTSSRLRLSYFAARRDYYDFYIDWLMQMDKEQPSRSLSAAAFEASERARARLLLDTIPLSRINIRNTRDTNLDDRKRRMHREINGLVQQLQTAQLSEAAINERNKRLESLLLELDDVQDQIAAVDLRYQNLISPSPLHLAEIQSQLRVDGTDTLLLEYSLGKDRSFLWAVTASSYHAFSDLPSRSEIEQLVRRLYESVDAHAANESAQALQGAATQYQKTSALLSQKLLGPIADFLNTKRVVVVADGALQFLPFAVLPMPKDPAGSPLIAEHEVVNLPSAAVLATLRLEKRSRSAPRQITVVADPVYSPEDPRVVRDKRAVTTSRSPGRVVDTAVDFVDRVRGGTAFSRLIYSRREARAILSLVSAEQARFALDFDADLRTASNPELTSVRILHFAVHAVLDSLRPSLSSLVFSLVDPHGQEKPGFLPLYEIYNLDLPAELVVLSACRTAIGAEIQGEGLESLARGFMHSGSSRLVASLWRVDDESTAELMKSFYRGILANGLTPAAALREAQNQMRKSRWHDPYYWAVAMNRVSEAPSERSDWNELTEQRFKLLRKKLEKYFEYNSPSYLVTDPLDMADETLSRVAAKIATGAVEPGKLEPFALGIARNVLHEEIDKYWKTVKLFDGLRRRLHFSNREETRDHQCVEAAIGSLEDDDRNFIEQYYHIKNKSIAQRARACSIKRTLRRLYQDCCNKKGSTN